MRLTLQWFVSNRTEIAERRMSPHPVVEAFDILEDGLPSLSLCSEGSAFDTFTLEGPEKRLSHGIVVTVARATHARRDACFCQQNPVSIASVL